MPGQTLADLKAVHQRLSNRVVTTSICWVVVALAVMIFGERVFGAPFSTPAKLVVSILTLIGLTAAVMLTMHLAMRGGRHVCVSCDRSIHAGQLLQANRTRSCPLCQGAIVNDRAPASPEARRRLGAWQMASFAPMVLKYATPLTFVALVILATLPVVAGPASILVLLGLICTLYTSMRTGARSHLAAGLLLLAAAVGVVAFRLTR